MAKTDRCPICSVAVKPENQLRHLSDTHPRHPDTPRLREELKAVQAQAPRRKSAAPIRVKPWHIALVVLIVSGGVGAYYAAPYLSTPPPTGPFPCVTGSLVYHWHPQLFVHSGANAVTIPANIGMSATCEEPLHTHSTDGVIHVETDVNRLYTIGDFFRVWGKSFDSPAQMLVNGTAVTSGANTILYDQETIHLYYDSFA